MRNVRADQVGSLLRPPELVQAWDRLFAGQLAPDRLREIEDRAIEAALEGQKRTGIEVSTDGEFRRIVYLTSLVQASDGFVMGQGEQLPWKASGGKVPEEMLHLDLLIDVARILAEEAGQLAREGVPYVQVDSPTYTMFADPSWDDWFVEHGIDKPRWLREVIAA